MPLPAPTRVNGGAAQLGAAAVPGDDTLNRLFDAALEIAQREQRLMEELRTALEAGDNERALALARKLTGLAE